LTVRSVYIWALEDEANHRRLKRMASQTSRDAEISALEVVIEALEPLDQDARSRVLEYSLRRLGMQELPAVEIVAPPAAAAAPVPEAMPVVQHPSAVVDIRTLREQKGPTSANEMAALAAYYLAELAPEAERTDTVASADIERLFKQAGYRLPSRIGMTLPNAAAAGYFDKAPGGWRLNPVGHNLVTQTLPRSGKAPAPRAPRKPVSNAARKPRTKKPPAKPSAKSTRTARTKRSR
jgi:hypothetical protein